LLVDRYLIHAITAPSLAVLAALALIFASYTSATFLADVAQGQIGLQIVATLVGLKVLIALEVLIPIGLYLGIIFGLGRLYRDQEMTALQAAGLPRATIIWPLLRFSLLIALLIAAISWLARPWAYQQIYKLEAAAEASIDLTRIEPGRFMRAGDDRFTILAESRQKQARRLDGVFLAREHAGDRLVLKAASMRQSESGPDGITLIFNDGHLYRLDRQGQRDLTVRFDELEWQVSTAQVSIDDERKAMSTPVLLSATGNEEIAERQWRLSRPSATLFLALLGIALSRSAPRRGRFANAFAAVATFALYYNLSAIARTWVEHGTVPAFPGIYWADILIGLLALGLLFRPGVTHY